MFKINISIEAVMLLDIILQFLIEFQPEDTLKRERDLTAIARRYIKGEFIIDILALFPFVYISST
jgi:hypothetical protein